MEEKEPPAQRPGALHFPKLVRGALPLQAQELKAGGRLQLQAVP